MKRGFQKPRVEMKLKWRHEIAPALIKIPVVFEIEINHFQVEMAEGKIKITTESS